MILRKPYAFLIKKFKLIHFILLLLAGYLGFITNNAVIFFDQYIEVGWYNVVVRGNFIDIYSFITIGIMILAYIFIYLLMNTKKKPRFFYMFSIITYIALIALFIYANNYISQMQYSQVDIIIVRAIRDLLRIGLYIQIFICAFVFTRAFGFNVKKFDFGDDLAELSLEGTDNEEVELTVGFDFDKVKTEIGKRSRNARYVFIENKLTIIIVISLICLLGGGYYILDKTIFNESYSETSVVSFNEIELVITDSFITKTDYRNRPIKNADVSYLIVRIDIKNKLAENKKIDVSMMKLLSGSKTYVPTQKLSEYFVDYGLAYTDNTIRASSVSKYIFIYELEDKDIKNNLIISYEEFGVKNKISINPKKADKNEDVSTVANNEQIVFTDSLFKNTSLSVASYEIAEHFTYSGKVCVGSSCKDTENEVNTQDNNRKIMKLYDVKVIVDPNIVIGNTKTSYEFFNKFVMLEYNIGATPKVVKPIVKNTSDAKNIYLEVSKEIDLASRISLIITVKNKTYRYIIKES